MLQAEDLRHPGHSAGGRVPLDSLTVQMEGKGRALEAESGAHFSRPGSSGALMVGRSVDR